MPARLSSGIHSLSHMCGWCIVYVERKRVRERVSKVVCVCKKEFVEWINNSASVGVSVIGVCRVSGAYIKFLV